MNHKSKPPASTKQMPTFKKVIFLNKFEKDYQKLMRRGKDPKKFEKVLSLLCSGNQSPAQLPTKYKDHKLTGNLKHLRDLHIEPDWLLIYQITSNEVICVRTGTHSDLLE